jgi:hypothetical protein
VINGTKVVPLGARIDGLGEIARLVVDAESGDEPRYRRKKSDARRQQARSMLRSTHAKFRNGSDTFDLRLAARVRDGSYWCDGATGTLR